jgi:hypothetical protein
MPTDGSKQPPVSASPPRKQGDERPLNLLHRFPMKWIWPKHHRNRGNCKTTASEILFGGGTVTAARIPYPLTDPGPTRLICPGNRSGGDGERQTSPTTAGDGHWQRIQGPTIRLARN